MNKIKIIFFPIGSHDTAGNKRLRNLAKYLGLKEDVEIIFFKRFGDKTIERNGARSFPKKVLYSLIDIVRVLYILIIEKESGQMRFLYFYEGRHLMLNRIIAAKILGYKILIDLVENPESVSHSGSIAYKVRTKYILFLYKFSSHYTSAFIVVTKYLRNKLLVDFKKKVPILLMAVTFDPDDFAVEPAHYNYPTIFYGGSYGGNYDFDSFFRAYNKVVEEIPDLRLFLSGNIDINMKEAICGMINKQDNIVLLGFLNEDDYFRTIISMDILCMPRNDSLHANAGFPFKLAEYLATGKPVITSRVSDVAEYINDNDAYIYEPGEYLKIEAFIKYILNNPEHANAIGKNGKIKALEKFSARSVSSDFYQFIANLN